MLLRTTLAVVAAAFAFGAAAQTGSLQSLLAALTQGTEVTLITHFANGTSQVTSFRPPTQLPPAEAAAAIERARAELAAFGVTQPSGEQLAVSLIGGTLDVPTGRTQLPGIVPQGPAGSAGAIRSQVVLTSALPQAMLARQATGVTAAQIGQAMQQLAGLGIANPTPEQLHVALTGGVVATPAGAVTLPTLFTLTLRTNGYVEVDLLALQTNLLGRVLNIGESGFRKPVTLTMTYARGTNVTDPSRLKIMRWKSDGRHEILPSRVDTDTKRVTAQLDHFSRYCMVAN